MRDIIHRRCIHREPINSWDQIMVKRTKVAPCQFKSACVYLYQLMQPTANVTICYNMYITHCVDNIFKRVFILILKNPNYWR